MNKVKRNTFFVIIVSLIILFLIFKNDFNEIVDILLKSNKIYIFLGIIVVLFVNFIRSLSNTILIREEYNEISIKEGYLLMLKTNFFNGITPYNIGGQPYQLLTYKNKYNLNYKNSINIIFKDFYSYQLSLMVVTTLSLIINYLFNIIEFSGIISTLVYLGYTINLVIAIFLLYIPYSKTRLSFVLNFIITLLYKLRIIKDKDKTLNNIDNEIINLKIKISTINKKRSTIVKCIFINSIKFIVNGIIIYLSFKSINLNISIINCIIIDLLLLSIASSIPIPGASGGVEYGFKMLFLSFFTDTKISVAMLIYRFLTYYLLIIIGGVLFIKESRK